MNQANEKQIPRRAEAVLVMTIRKVKMKPEQGLGPVNFDQQNSHMRDGSVLGAHAFRRLGLDTHA